MNQENGAPQALRRPPSTSGSIILIVLILFMMFGGESQRVSQDDMSERLVLNKYELCKLDEHPQRTLSNPS
jgi:hypothetical protein